jgi:hypothetical protein
MLCHVYPIGDSDVHGILQGYMKGRNMRVDGGRDVYRSFLSNHGIVRQCLFTLIALHNEDQRLAFGCSIIKQILRGRRRGDWEWLNRIYPTG